MSKDWTGSVEILAIALSAVCLLIALVMQAVIPAVVGVLPLLFLVGLNSRYRRQNEAARTQVKLRIDRLEQVCADQNAYVNRLAGTTATTPGQEAILMRMRRAMAESYAKTQNRLIALETGEVTSLRQDVSELRSNYQILQQKLGELPQLTERVQHIEQYLHQLQEHLSQLPQQFASAEIVAEIQALRNSAAPPADELLTDINSRLIHIEAAIQDLNYRFTDIAQPVNLNRGTSQLPEEVYVLQILRQKLQEPETILHPDHSVELPTGMGVQMRFVRLIRRSDAISICEKLVRNPDLRVPAATVSWVKSRFTGGVRELETVIYRNRYGSSDKYLFLYEVMKLIDDLIAEFETVQASRAREL